MLPASLAVVLALSACGTSEAGPSWPTADVELVTDDLGVTHVRAGSDEDAFYGAGYAMARDRLFQMELSRRRALGTSAAIFGARALRDDIGARTFDFGGLGARDLARTQRERPDDVRLVDAWIAGVNARIDEIRDGASPRPYGLRSGELDFVPEPWRAEHAFAVGKLLAFGLSSSLESELLATALTRVAPSFAGRVPLSLPASDPALAASRDDAGQAESHGLGA